MGIGEGILRHAARIVLAVTPPLAPHRDGELLGKGVDTGHAHAVQAARDLVARVVELAARMELGHDHLHRGHALLGMDVHRDAAAVVAHGDGIDCLATPIPITQKEAAIEAVKKIGLNQISPINPNWFQNDQQKYEMFLKRLSILKKETC